MASFLVIRKILFVKIMIDDFRVKYTYHENTVTCFGFQLKIFINQAHSFLKFSYETQFSCSYSVFACILMNTSHKYMSLYVMHNNFDLLYFV